MTRFYIYCEFIIISAWPIFVDCQWSCRRHNSMDKMHDRFIQNALHYLLRINIREEEHKIHEIEQPQILSTLQHTNNQIRLKTCVNEFVAIISALLQFHKKGLLHKFVFIAIK